MSPHPHPKHVMLVCLRFQVELINLSPAFSQYLAAFSSKREQPLDIRTESQVNEQIYVRSQVKKTFLFLPLRVFWEGDIMVEMNSYVQGMMDSQ